MNYSLDARRRGIVVIEPTSGLEALISAQVLVSRLCIGLMIVAMSMKLQRKTMQSIFLSFDDDGYW